MTNKFPKFLKKRNKNVYKTYITLSYFLVGILLLAGCNDGSSKVGDEKSKAATEPDPRGNLIEIKMLPPEGQLSVPANSKMKLRITGIYENGTSDLTEQVEMRILDDVSNITFTEDKQIQAGAWDSSGAYNETRIEAEFENIIAELTIKVIEGVCDETLTLAQVETLDGTCIKSYTYDGKEYVFTPREKFMRELGYTPDDRPENQGRTYGRVHSEDYPYALFRRDGEKKTWENFLQNNPYGQAERYCNDLAKMSFNNKDGWKMATTEELNELITHHVNNNLMETEGLPLYYFSLWGRDVSKTTYSSFTVDTAKNKVQRYLFGKHAVICRSE